MSAYHQPMPWEVSQQQHQHVDFNQQPQQVQQPIAHGGPVVDDGYEVFIGRLPLTITKVILSLFFRLNFQFTRKTNLNNYLTKFQFKLILNFQNYFRFSKNKTQVDLDTIAAPYEPSQIRIMPKKEFPHLCAFMHFDDVNAAAGFVEKFNGAMPFGGSELLNVRFSDGKNSTKKVFIGGLAPRTTAAGLKMIVAPYGTVLQVNVLAKNKRAPCGFVTFANGNDANNCIMQMNGMVNTSGTKKYVVKLGEACVSGKNNNNKRRDHHAQTSFNHKHASPTKRQRTEWGHSASDRTRSSTPRDDNIGVSAHSSNMNTHQQAPMMQNAAFNTAATMTSPSVSPDSNGNWVTSHDVMHGQVFVPVHQVHQGFTPINMMTPMSPWTPGQDGSQTPMTQVPPPMFSPNCQPAPLQNNQYQYQSPNNNYEQNFVASLPLTHATSQVEYVHAPSMYSVQH